MKNYLRFLSPVMLLLMAVMFGGGKILAQTANLTFTAKCGGKGTDNQKGAWVIKSDAQELDIDNIKGLHYGSGSKAVSYLKASTSSYSDKVITKIVVNASGASGTSAKLSCTVGNASFGATQSVSATAKDYSFVDSATGEIVISLQQTSAKKALYLKSIEVTYKESDGKTKTTLSFPTPSYTYEVAQNGGTVTIEDNIAVLKDKDGKEIFDATGKIIYSVESSVEDFAILGGDENSSSIIVDTNKEGTATVTATFDAAGTDEKYSTSTATYTIKVTKRQTTLSFGEAYDDKTIIANLGDEFTAPTATLTPNIEGETIKYSSSKPTVATVDETTGAVTIVGAGTTVITADFVGDDTYVASKASYTINVVNAIASIADLKTKITNKSKNFTLKLSDAVVSYVYGDRAYIEDASAGILVFLKGSQTLVAGQKFNGLVEVAAQTWHNLPEITSWTASPSMTTETVTELPLEVVTVEELKNNYKKYEGRRVKVLGVTITKIFTSDDLSGEITQNGLSITLRAGDNPIETTLNDIVNVIGFPTIYNTGKQLAIWEQSAIDVINTETLTTSAGGYATYSADYAVNYSELGLTAYTLTVDETNKTVTAKEFTGVVPAGGAVLVKGTASKAYTLTPATTEGDASFATNLQTGATTADGTQYGFTTKFGTPAFAQVASGQDIPAKKGYIVLSGASAAKYSICFGDEATGIQTIEAASAANAAMYNLAGQRVDKSYKGIVIVNGKKYLNK